MKLSIVVALLLTALGGCAITTAPSSTGSRPASARDRSSEDCRGVWDNLANTCIGG